MKNLHSTAFTPCASVRQALDSPVVGKREISAWMAALARRKARKMSKAERKAHALKMNAARWGKKVAV